jgi:hypothetical protein
VKYLQLEELLVEVIDGGLLKALICVLLLVKPCARCDVWIMQHPLEVTSIREAPGNAYSTNGIQPVA